MRVFRFVVSNFRSPFGPVEFDLSDQECERLFPLMGLPVLREEQGCLVGALPKFRTLRQLDCAMWQHDCPEKHLFWTERKRWCQLCVNLNVLGSLGLREASFFLEESFRGSRVPYRGDISFSLRPAGASVVRYADPQPLLPWRDYDDPHGHLPGGGWWTYEKVCGLWRWPRGR